MRNLSSVIRTKWLALLAAATLVMGACSGSDASNDGEKDAPDSRQSSASAQATEPKGRWFRDVAADRGLGRIHVNAASSKKYMPETLGSGGALADFNGDGRLDCYLIHQRSLLDPSSTMSVVNRIYFQDEEGQFIDRTESSGAAADAGFGQGCAVADFDGDGDQDIYLCNFGENRLLANDGQGSFRDVTAKAGVGESRWSVSAVFFDYDGDRDLDLFCVNYVDYSVAKNIDCFVAGTLTYCSPQSYAATANTLYRNNGDGTFEDVSRASGIAAHPGKGLGVSLADFDADGRVDVYVANDGTANFLFRNAGEGRFEELGLETGTAFNESGVAEAGMGTDFVDIDGSGFPDILVTNLDRELNNLFVNSGEGYFEEAARESGLGSISNPYVGFGVRAFDYENDGDLDVYVTNGHISDNIESIDAEAKYAQEDFLFLQDSAMRFREVLVPSGDVPRRVGRGLATGDIDDDGDLDLLITNNGQAPLLLENLQGFGQSWVGLSLLDSGPGKSAWGARVEVRVDDQVFRAHHLPRGSYVSAHDPRLVIGLGKISAAKVDLRVIWPGGKQQDIRGLVPNRYHEIQEGR